MEKDLTRSKTGISKTIIVVALIIAIVAVGAGAYYFATQNNQPSPSASPTPTPLTSPTASANPTTSTSPTVAPTQTATASPTASPSNAPNVAGASSLKYSVSLTEAGILQGSYTYQGKNAGTSSFMMRIDFTDSDGSQSGYIINGAQQKAWSLSGGTWEDLTSAYSSLYNTWNPLWQGYVNSLSGWAGVGDWTYTQGNVTVRIYDISVNPALPDSLFQPT